MDRKRERAERYFASGNLPAARAACDALLRDPASVVFAHWLLSEIALREGHVRASHQHALQAAQGAAGASLNQRLLVSRSLINLGADEAAHRLLIGDAIGKDSDPGACIAAAEQMLRIDGIAEAQQFLLAAGGQAQEMPMACVMSGDLYKYQGNVAAARAGYERALHRAPGYAPALLALAGLRLPDDSPLRIDQIRRAQREVQSAAGDSSVRNRQRVMLGYALFKELDRTDDTAGAWAALAEAMQLQRASRRYEAAAESALVAELKRQFPAPGKAAESPAGDEPTPIFIVGLPRSGTTLVERILGQHPEVSAGGELTTLPSALQIELDTYSAGEVSPALLQKLDSLSRPAFARRYLDGIRWRRHGRAFVTDKNQRNFWWVGLILQAFPMARIIHVRKSALDSCFSNLKELFADGSYTYSYALEDVAAHYRNYSALMQHYQALAAGRLLTIEYQDLVEAPEAVTERLLVHCGLSSRAGLSDVASNPLPVTTASSMQVREPIHRRSIDAWQRYAAQLAPLRKLLEE